MQDEVDDNEKQALKDWNSIICRAALCILA